MVESVALEMRSAGNGTEGSNPSLSSIFFPQRDEIGLFDRGCEITCPGHPDTWWAPKVEGYASIAETPLTSAPAPTHWNLAEPDETVLPTTVGHDGSAEVTPPTMHL